MHHGIVDVFAFQEALLIEAVFGLALLTMIWIGFRRWLQSREKIGRMSTEQMERIEARLNTIEQLVTPRAARTDAQIEAPSADPLPNPILKDELHSKP